MKGLIFVLATFCWAISFAQEVKLGLPVGHTDDVNSAVYSPDGKTILTTSGDHTARIWDSSTGILLYVLKGHSDRVNFAIFNFNGKKVMTVSEDRSVCIWSITGELLITLMGHTNHVTSAVFSLDGKKVLTSSYDNTACIWDSESGELIQTFKGHTDYVNSAVFSPDGKKVLTASDDNTSCIWDSESGELIQTFKGHTDNVNSAVFSTDGKKVLTASYDNTACIWDCSSGLVLQELEGHKFYVFSAIYSPDGKKVMTVSLDKTARIWDSTSGELIQSLEGHNDYINTAVFSADGKMVLTASWDNTARFWDSESGELIQTFIGHSEEVNSAVFSPDGKAVLTASNDFTARIWEVSSKEPILTLEGRTTKVSSAVFSFGDKTLFSSAVGENVFIWEQASGKLIQSLIGHTRTVTSVFFSFDGKRVLTASCDSTACIWNSDSGKLIQTFKGHTDNVNSAVFSPDGKKVLTASDDHTARIWDSESGELIRIIDGDSVINWDHDSGNFIETTDGHRSSVTSAVFSTDGKLVLTGSIDGTARIWDCTSGEQLKVFDEPYFVRSADFSSDGKMVLLVSSSGTRIYDIASGFELQRFLASYFASFNLDGKKVLTVPVSDEYCVQISDVESSDLLQTFNGHTSSVNSGSFSPDEKSLLTASSDGSLIFWEVQNSKQLVRQYIFNSDPKKWVHLHPSGLFDASPEAMELMYWTKGLEVIEFAQLKDRYWVPGLWEKVMKGETLPDVRGMNELKLQPEVQLGQVVDGKLPITLTKRDGGYGAVSISINGKEVISDARGNEIDTAQQVQTIYYSIKDHPYLQNGENVISVKASSADGFVTGRGEGFKYLMEKKEAEKPNFYAIVIGVSDYVNDAIDLKYPEKDAKALSEAVKLGAGKLFGTEKSEVYTLTAAEGKRPNKETIQAAFKQVASKAKAQDVLMVYLSGHGVTWGGDQGDFYFLTADATAAHKDAYNDPAIRSTATISSSEMVEWIKEIPALKQVMIIDACGSGKAVDNLVAARDVESSQIKAIDRMKDRTGMFVISGCAADAVSYEASQYGQGLLTYAILQAMKGAALKEDKYVDVFTILQHARENVPKLAAGLGGIQEPQFLHPKGGSFDIGILEQEDKAKIALAEPKRVFVRSVLVEKSKYRDVLGLSTLLNNALSDLSSRGTNAQLVFFDAEEYGNSCQLTGGYKELDGIIELDLNIVCNGSEMTHQLKASSSTELVEQIIELVNK